MHLTTHADGTCTVEREYRLHNSETIPPHPTAVGSYQVNEREGTREPGETFRPRIAKAITVITWDGNRSRTRTYRLRGGPVSRWSFPH